MSHRISLTRIVSMTDRVASQLQELHFSTMGLPAKAWCPPVNVYAYADRLEVCVDLAGVPRSDIEVRIEPQRLVISGHRASPQRDCGESACGRILIMEIADGNFERILNLPPEVSTERAEAIQDNGLLWIILPKQ